MRVDNHDPPGIGDREIGA